MTPQEEQLLKGLADRINQTVLQDKDPEAEQFLTQSLSRNPDALYIMAQTILVQQFAVDNAKKQLDDLKQQLEQAKQMAQQAAQPVKHTSFLGGLLGGDEPQRPAPPPPPPQQQYGQPQYQPVQNYAPPQYGQPVYAQPVYAQPVYAQPSLIPGGSGGSGFLGSALRTAGIVGAGALAFEGVEGLMHGFGEHAGYGGGYGMGEMGGGPREEIINNYYDGDRPEHRGLSDDIEDRRDDGDNQRGFADTSSDDDSTGDDSTDDSSFDDSSSDDSSSFDDSSDDGN